MTLEGHRYMDITAARIKQAMLTNAIPFRHGIHVTADVYPPDKRERNIDSVARILTDSIRQTGWQIPDVVTAVRQPRPRQGGCVLYFWE